MTKAQTQQACQLLMMQVTITDYATITYKSKQSLQGFIGWTNPLKELKIVPNFSFAEGCIDLVPFTKRKLLQKRLPQKKQLLKRKQVENEKELVPKRI